MNIGENIRQLVKITSAKNCTLVAISKNKSTREILEAYQAGQRDFGENRVQELIIKYNDLPGDIRWHMVGHLQSNKVKAIAPFIGMIHSIDSLKLLNEINKQATNAGRIIPCLLQVHIAAEETKFGFSHDELFNLLKLPGIPELKHVLIKGLMGMATLTDDKEKVRREFRNLKILFERIREVTLPENISIEVLSMGMSGDYELAIEEGSNMVRIGTAIFGERNPIMD
ncbi:MAG TPA: YggS family pyridoxal phosphate-dependent enzyme [Cyclobacteriaceae bacterium]|nr:YggS family pyridoxal phosphate-dependent enzyme [Cyclobacteriaceae bacterium]